jgi:hypothetical protein
MSPRHLASFALLAGFTLTAKAWDYEGHRIVNQLALAGLPADFPAFVRTPAAAERIAFLAGEPDRWRNNGDLPIKHFNGLDHYINWDQLAAAGLDPATVSPLRYEFTLQFAAGRAAHADKLPAIVAEKNADHVQEWPGFLPWSITEYYGKLRAAFSYLKVFRADGGTPEEIADAEANIIYLMGVMGHYVGDGAQPLHVTVHHNGWTGDNPHGYSTWPKLHAWIDGGFIAKAGITEAGLAGRARPAHVLFPLGATSPRDPMFDAVMAYLATQNGRVDELYQIDKARGFSTEPSAAAASGRAFIEEQLLRGGEMLSAIWLTAWTDTTPDPFLNAYLIKRQLAEHSAPPATPAPAAAAPAAAVTPAQ